MPRLRPVQSKPEEEVETTIASSAEEQIVNVEEPVIEAAEPEADDASQALQKQLAELRKSEELARQRADQAVKDREAALASARERETQIAKFQKEAQQSQADAINSALAAATSDAEKAQQDIENAASLGDTKGQAEAYRRLARAEANIARLEDGKTEIEARQKEPQPQPQQQPIDPIDRMPIPDQAKSWLRSHNDYLTNPRLNAKINAAHYDLLEEGYVAYTPEYITAMEEKLGLRQRQQEPQVQQQRSSIMSAPVSRDVPTSTPQQRNGQIRLTAAQREAAKLAGVTEKTYAEQLQKLNEMRSNGSYGERQ